MKILLVFGGLPHKLAALMQILAEAPILGTALPGFRDYNPPQLRLSESLRPYATKETKFISLAGVPPLPTLLHPAWLPVHDQLANDR